MYGAKLFMRSNLNINKQKSKISKQHVHVKFTTPAPTLPYSTVGAHNQTFTLEEKLILETGDSIWVESQVGGRVTVTVTYTDI